MQFISDGDNCVIVGQEKRPQRKCWVTGAEAWRETRDGNTEARVAIGKEEPACRAGDTLGRAGKIPAGDGKPLQCTCLGNCMNRGAWQAPSMGSQGVRRD